MQLFNNHNEIHRAMRNLFATKEGRAVLAYILNYCGVDRSTFDRDAQTQSYKNGKRDVGLHFMEVLHTNTMQFTEELKEH